MKKPLKYKSRKDKFNSNTVNEYTKEWNPEDWQGRSKSRVVFSERLTMWAGGIVVIGFMTYGLYVIINYILESFIN